MRRSLLIAGVTGFVGLTLVVGATLWPEKEVPTRLVGPVRSVSSPTERALTFAVRAVDQAGLVDWTGTAYEFERIDESDGGWEVTFRHYECPTDGRAGCVDADPPLVLTVVVRERHLHVIAFEGELESGQETLLRGYEEKPRPERIGFELIGPRLVASEGSLTRLVTSWMWSGPLPSPGFGAICRPFLLNRDFERVGRMRVHSFASPGSGPNEVRRTGGLWLSPVPRGVKDAWLVDGGGCRVVKVAGWRPDGSGTISGWDGQTARVLVPLRWDGPIAPIVTTCIATAFDMDGTELATATHNIEAHPLVNGSGPHGRTRPMESWEIGVNPAEVAETKVTCRPWRPDGSG